MEDLFIKAATVIAVGLANVFELPQHCTAGHSHTKAKRVRATDFAKHKSEEEFPAEFRQCCPESCGREAEARQR